MIDVHTEHCCLLHGCKYRNDDCTVITEKAPQSFVCEACQSEEPFNVQYEDQITLQRCREEIDGIDIRLIQLLNARQQVVDRVKILALAEDLSTDEVAVVDAARKAPTYRRKVVGVIGGRLDHAAIERIFKAIQNEEI